MNCALVTGASRGLGLEFTHQLLDAGWRVIAACRKPGQAQALTKLALSHPGRLAVLPLDLTKPASIAELAREAALVSEHVDLLINNAGMLPEGERFGALEAKAMEQSFATNVIGPMLVTQALVPLLERSKGARVVNISSILGSIAAREHFGTPSYSISKAALNMATRLLALELAPRGIVVVALHPGWVRTDMGGAKADLAPDESVRGLRQVIAGLGIADAGCFLNWKGESLPW